MKKTYLLGFLVTALFLVIPILFHDRLEEFKNWGLFGLFLINVIGSANLFLPVPAIASVVAGGGLYPPLIVALVAALGSTIGDTVGYFIGSSGKKVVRVKNEHPKLEKLRSLFHHYGVIIILVAAFIPNVFFDAIGIVAGAAGYPFWRFVIAVFLGRLIRNIMLAYTGMYFF